MFNKKDQKMTKMNVRRLKVVQKGNEKREEKRAQRREEEESSSKEQVREIISFNSLLAARFGMFILFQLQNQDQITEIIRDQVSENTGIDVEKLKNNNFLLETIDNGGLTEEMGSGTKDLVNDHFLDSEHVETAQQILLHHFQDEEANFGAMIKSFNDSLMERIEKRQTEGMEPISTTLN